MRLVCFYISRLRGINRNYGVKITRYKGEGSEQLEVWLWRVVKGNEGSAINVFGGR